MDSSIGPFDITHDEEGNLYVTDYEITVFKSSIHKESFSVF